MSRSKARKQSEIVLAELTRKSEKGLEFAKGIILSEKVQYVKLRDAMEYYVSNWNDFTHPGLFAAAYEAVGGDLHVAIPIQAAVAMIAAAFDIHDDIVDKSKLKHGESTVFGKFGEEIALLLGNAFLIGGFTLFGKSLKGSDKRKAEVFETLKQSLYEFGKAHALELCLKKKADALPEKYLEIVKMKAASIEGDMRIGAMIGGGTQEEVEALASYGRILGTLAILREEFVDVFDVDELIQRVSNEYMPIPILYAMQDTISKKKIEELLARKITSGDVDALVDTVFKTQKVKDLKTYMKYLVDKAIHIASNVQNKNLRDQLRSFASSSIEDL